MTDRTAPPRPTTSRTRPNAPRRRWLLGALLPAVLLAAGLVVWWGPWRTPPTPAADPFPLPPLSPSPFLNTGPEARHVGSAACRPCHPSHHASARRTGMGRSMAEVDPARAPPDGAFDHPPSKRRYQVRRAGGRLWHRELLLADGPQEVVLAEHPLRYVVGSGRHSLTYLVEADGFLVESPVTWYASRKAWGMSPGYDTPEQEGFERAAGESCLVCHAGQAEAVGGTLHRMRVTEATIGCERCHGPGSLHVERHAEPGRALGGVDTTIVNPAHLPRALAEAVCQQCHLRSSAMVVARGRKLTEFRPGLPLQDVREDYWLDEPGSAMTVVGHVEQLHRSRCYQTSDTLTCRSCHDPHNEPPAARRVAHYRSACLECHRPEACTVSAQRRRKESPDNDCTHCHMPRSPTEIPHLAFTHHRIGLHDPPRPAVADHGHSPGRGVLRPFLDLGRLGDVDRKRSLGLAYLEAANKARHPASAERYREQALALMSEARAAGLCDPVLDASLARLRSDLARGDVVACAESALSQTGLEAQDRWNALFLLADAHHAAGRYAEAVAALRQLLPLRRHSTQWVLLADCEKALGNEGAAVEALSNAVRINPRLWKLHRYLAEHFRRRGDAGRAAWHQQRAVP